MLKMGDALLGKYEILDIVGKGGMSSVFLAKDAELNKVWAIKEIDKTTPAYKLTVNEEDTLNELKVMRELSHPCIPRAVDVIEENDTIAIVMDYIEGESLLQKLDNEGPQAEEDVARWAIEICDVLNYLHHAEPQIIYRDLKPSNILVCPDGSLRLIDFGIAKEYHSDTEDEFAMGTKGYTSPEHYTRKTDERSDIYTVGVTMHQLLTGENPAKAPKPLLPIRQINPDLSEGLETIIRKATQKTPRYRYQSAIEMKEALQNYKRGDRGYEQEIKKKKTKVRTMFLCGGLCILFALLSFGAFFLARNAQYEQNIAIGDVESSLDAIQLKPEAAEGYAALLSALADNGITENEEKLFQSTYNKNQKAINEGKEGQDIAYIAGRAALIYGRGLAEERLISTSTYWKAAEQVPLANKFYELNQLLTDYREKGLTAATADQVIVTGEEIMELLAVYYNEDTELNAAALGAIQEVVAELIPEYQKAGFSCEAAEALCAKAGERRELQ